MKKITVLFFVVLVFVIGFIIWWQNGSIAVNSNNNDYIIFVIPKGAEVRSIGNDLKTEGLIRDPIVFFLYLKKNNLDRSIQAGSYKISPSMNLSEIVDTLLVGSLDIWITIPEGYRSEEIAEVLSENLDTYDETWVGELKNEEGFLFPDTYLVPKDADVETIISIMRNNFNAKVESTGLAPDDPKLINAVIMASLIEREAIRDDEKPLIASVIHNRLNSGMALDIDATLQYIKGIDAQGNWWGVPTGQERQINSPYNTYRNSGLPPAPIASPGIVAIEAALNPAKSPYYFYIHDREGRVHFAKTLEEHNANVNRYLR